jgi:hypothetical protein
MTPNIIDNIILREAGIFKKAVTGNFDEKNEQSPTGYFKRTDGIVLIEETSRIPARIGIVFGITYDIKATNTEMVATESKIYHPKLKDPKTGNAFNESNEAVWDDPNCTNYDFYEFEYDWELKEGIWRFIIAFNNKIMLSHEFNVVEV